MLATPLREREQDGIIHWKGYAEVPPEVEYTLTQYGLTPEPIVSQLYDWGQHTANCERQNGGVGLTHFY